MDEKPPVIEIENLHRSYGRSDAVMGLNLTVKAGRCYGFFGRNGAGKTTTIKCMLNLLRRDSGSIKLFGEDPAKDEVAVKSRLAYVPDTISFYPWMTVRDYFDYLASFRKHWNDHLRRDLLNQFDLDETKKVQDQSKGERMQVALIGALCPEPELLILDEPTSGLDPLVRQEFIRTVIGAYQEGDPDNRTIFVSTHLITEFEGLIDEFTIIEQGRNLLTMETEEARAQFQKLWISTKDAQTEPQFTDALHIRQMGKELEVTVNGNASEIIEQARRQGLEIVREENLTLEEVFLASLRKETEAL
ncbi:MAG TPA: ABC transporter ATP-binding protein [Verrucomicrobiales bacterium]|nr:ABC transporter ATP-binding protein [Verrucomicrobiales bacterium]